MTTRSTRRFGATILAMIALAVATSSTLAATPHSGNPGGNCDGYNTPAKTDTNDAGIVLAAGTVFCVKQSNSNTGTLVADGVTSLGQYAAAAGLPFGVSNYVVYQVPAPTPTPTPTPTFEQEIGEPASTTVPTPVVAEVPNTAMATETSDWLVLFFGAVLTFVGGAMAFRALILHRLR